MYSIILTIHVLLALSIVVLILLQQSKGGAGALGGGASESFFGSRGSFSLLMKVTSVFVALFFATSMGLAVLTKRDFGSDINQDVIRQQQNQPQVEEGTQLPSFEEQQQEIQQRIQQENSANPDEQ
ncbi:MAG: preprotein translocase subunit SecG [Gammaproteobacteria bacterium]|nr:preprotein translocase subunit SecG [Gammaproteobacteria bacterium]